MAGHPKQGSKSGIGRGAVVTADEDAGSVIEAASRLNAASLDKAVTGGSGGVPTAFKSNNALLPFWSGGHIDVSGKAPHELVNRTAAASKPPPKFEVKTSSMYRPTYSGASYLDNARRASFGSAAAGAGPIAETSTAYHDRIARETALLNAVWTKQSHSVAEMIVDHGKGIANGTGDLNALYTPLHYAAILGTEQIAVLLIAAGADMALQSANGYTALHWVAKCGDDSSKEHGKVAALLLANGASLFAKAQGGETAMEVAVTAGNKNMVGLLKHHAKKLQKVVAAEAQARLAEDALKSKEQQKQVWRQDREAREKKDAASRQAMLQRRAAQNTVLAASAQKERLEHEARVDKAKASEGTEYEARRKASALKAMLGRN